MKSSAKQGILVNHFLWVAFALSLSIPASAAFANPALTSEDTKRMAPTISAGNPQGVKTPPPAPPAKDPMAAFLGGGTPMPSPKPPVASAKKPVAAPTPKEPVVKPKKGDPIYVITDPTVKPPKVLTPKEYQELLEKMRKEMEEALRKEYEDIKVTEEELRKEMEEKMKEELKKQIKITIQQTDPKTGKPKGPKTPITPADYEKYMEAMRRAAEEAAKK